MDLTNPSQAEAMACHMFAQEVVLGALLEALAKTAPSAAQELVRLLRDALPEFEKEQYPRGLRESVLKSVALIESNLATLRPPRGPVQ